MSDSPPDNKQHQEDSDVEPVRVQPAPDAELIPAPTAAPIVFAFGPLILRSCYSAFALFALPRPRPPLGRLPPAPLTPPSALSFYSITAPDADIMVLSDLS